MGAIVLPIGNVNLPILAKDVTRFGLSASCKERSAPRRDRDEVSSLEKHQRFNLNLNIRTVSLQSLKVNLRFHSKPENERRK